MNTEEGAVAPQATGEGEPTTPKPTVESLQAELEKKTELADNYKIRAEKAEKAGKKLEEPKPTETGEPTPTKEITNMVKCFKRKA